MIVELKARSSERDDGGMLPYTSKDVVVAAEPGKAVCIAGAALKTTIELSIISQGCRWLHRSLDLPRSWDGRVDLQLRGRHNADCRLTVRSSERSSQA